MTIKISVEATTLLTAEPLRVAAGLASNDSSRDTDLAKIGLTAADCQRWRYLDRNERLRLDQPYPEIVTAL